MSVTVERLHPVDVDLWADPLCPWCWVTARWLVDEVAPARGLTVHWHPLSLLVKNGTAADSPHYPALARSYGLLRVMEAVRASEGEAPLGALYLAYGLRIHHRRDPFFPVEDALRDAGLDPAHAAALTDPQWDEAVLARHHDGLSLVGDQVGTPIVAVRDADGRRQGIYGPIITRVPSPEQALALWDGVVACITVPGFWELKRTRTDRPEPGAPPALPPATRPDRGVRPS